MCSYLSCARQFLKCNAQNAIFKYWNQRIVYCTCGHLLNAVQQICPHHGDALLDGNAHFVRYGEIIHDGSGQPDSANSQEEADSETFVMGNDAAEKNVERCRFWRRTFNNLGNVYGCDDECGDIHGKEFHG